MMCLNFITVNSLNMLACYLSNIEKKKHIYLANMNDILMSLSTFVILFYTTSSKYKFDNLYTATDACT